MTVIGLLVAALLLPAGVQLLPAGVQRAEDGRYVSALDGAELVEIPAGAYTIGAADGRYDEAPPVRVRLQAFFIDRAEVTNRQYAAFVAATGYRAEGHWQRGDAPGAAEHPVRFVTWADARAYARWAGRRLPTEAEWEVAAGPHRFPGGDRWQPDRAVVGRPLDAGPEPANRALDATARGVLNMAGNVREWVGDWYDRRAYAAYDPAVPARSARRQS